MEEQMDEKKEQDLRSLQLTFIGKIIASFTHEIKNHIAIIKESAGLIGDLLKLGKSSKNDSQQYFEIISSIEEQIERSIEQFRYLNRFAHRMDMPFSQVNVNECLEDLVALLQRVANQRKIAFEQDFQRDLPSIHTNPSMLQFLVFCSIENKIARLGKNSKIILKTGHLSGSVSISITTQGDFTVTDTEAGICPHEIHDYVINQLSGTFLKQNGETVIQLPVSAG
jgi:nitrogen-specific signal transduction histidine kinase